MGIRFSEDALLEFLSGSMSESREQKLIEEMSVSNDLCERIDRLSGAMDLSRIQQSVGTAVEIPPLDKKLVERLYDCKPASISQCQFNDATTIHEPQGFESEFVLNGNGRSRHDENWLGEYELIEEIGSGGAGVVFRARHRKLNRMAAVKVLSSRVASNPSAIQRFHREIEAIGNLKHPNIIQAEYAGESAGRHYLAMEYVKCHDLVVVVRTVGPLEISDACAIAEQCAQGLQHAHQSKIVHRDIKPSNLLLTDDGLVKIADFGLAKLREPLGAAGRFETIDKYVMGTLEFMAPEQLDDSRNVDIRADVYSLGCTLFYLLTGKTPHSEAYDKGGLLSMLNARESRKPAKASEFRDDLPIEILKVLDKMLAPRPEDRYASPDEVCDALAEFANRGDLPKLWSRVAESLPPTRAQSAGDNVLSSTHGTSATIAAVPDIRNEPKSTIANSTDSPAERRKPPSKPRRWLFPLLATVAGCVLVATTLVLGAKGDLVLTIDQPNVSVSVDGEPLLAAGHGEIDKEITIPLPPGEHEFVVTKAGFRTYTARAVVERFRVVEVPVSLQRKEFPPPPPPPEPNPEPKPVPFSPAELERREIAKWLLKLGVRKMTVVTANDTIWKLDQNPEVKDIPKEPFRVTELECYNIQEIGDSSVKRIYKLEHLKDLSLRQTRVSTSGLTGIENLKQLRRLSLWEVAITNDGLKQLNSLENLEVLVLRATRIDDDGLKILLANNKNLNDLKIGRNKITDAGMEHLAKFPFLTHVGLDGSKVTMKGLRILLQNKSLVRVFIGRTSLWDAAELKSLRKSYPKVNIETSKG